MHFRKNLLSTLIFLPFFLLLMSGCGSKVLREDVVNTNNLHVQLRSNLHSGEVVQREFGHPAIIAPIRLTNILSHLEIETKQKTKTERVAAVPWALQLPLGEALAEALEKATPDQEIIVYAIDRDYRLGIFVEKKLTTLVAFMRDDRLELHFASSGFIIPKGDSKIGQELPEPHINEQVMDFRLVPSDDAMISTGAQSVSVDWRAETFRRAGRTIVKPGEKAVQREILLQEAKEPEEVDSDGKSRHGPRPSSSQSLRDLTPQQREALNQLEDERQKGTVTEADYQIRYQKILQGK